MKRLGIVVLAILIAAPATAQFYSIPSPNLQMMTNSVANQAFTQSVTRNRVDTSEEDAPTASANPALLRFTPNLATRKTNLAGFVAKTRAQSPENADQMAQLFESTDIFAAMAQALAPMGLQVDNVADAYTAYWVTAWEASRGIGGTDTPRAQAQAVKAQAANALLNTQEFAGAPAAQKQELAEALLIHTVLISAAMHGAAGNADQIALISKAVRKGAAGMGIDLDAMELGPDGFHATK